jgi:hypothetical protein
LRHNFRNLTLSLEFGLIIIIIMDTVKSVISEQTNIHKIDGGATMMEVVEDGRGFQEARLHRSSVE